MGKVLLTIQIMPSSTDIDLKKLRGTIQKLKDVGAIREIREEPVAFGLKALVLLTLVDDTGGVADAIEDRLKKLDGVQDARVTDLTLV